MYFWLPLTLLSGKTLSSDVCKVTNEHHSVKEAEEEGKKKTCNADPKIPHEDLVQLTTST